MRIKSFSSTLRFVLSLMMALLFTGASLLEAQVDTGSVGGVVTDVTGAVIPDAELVLREEKTGVSSQLHAGKDGVFNFSPVKLGIYTLTVSHEGFKQSVIEHLEVTIQARLDVRPHLDAGSVSEVVQVTSDNPLLETRSSSVQQLVD
jgi:hypothetical protein